MIFLLPYYVPICFLPCHYCYLSKNKFTMQFLCLLIGWNPMDAIAYKMKFKCLDKQAFILLVLLMSLKCCLSWTAPLFLDAKEASTCREVFVYFLSLHHPLLWRPPSSSSYPLRPGTVLKSLLPYVQPQCHLTFPSDWNKPQFSFLSWICQSFC